MHRDLPPPPLSSLTLVSSLALFYTFIPDFFVGERRLESICDRKDCEPNYPESSFPSRKIGKRMLFA